MPEPVSRTPDFPNFDTYPGRIPSAERALPERGVGGDRLTDAAETIGESLGNAVVRARELPQQLRQRFVLIRGRARVGATTAGSDLADKASDLKDAARDRAQRASVVARERLAQARLMARDQIDRARVRVDYLTENYPLQILAGVAGAAFVLGVTLRLWRSSRA